jgi:hypothetical protein
VSTKGNLVLSIQDNKIVFVFHQRQQNLFILFYYDNMLRSPDRHQAVSTKRSANNIGTDLHLVMSFVEMA